MVTISVYFIKMGLIHAMQSNGPLHQVMISKDNTSTMSLWKVVRTSAQLIYVSPEMALSDSFTKLWKDVNFWKCLQAIVVNEAHCINEWGEEFWPQYWQLSQLWHYTGQDVPFVACTTTCTSKTFDVIWHSLGYGHWPFWGIDVESERLNLLFLTRILENVKNLVLDVLNILPKVLDVNTPCEAIDKSLFLFWQWGGLPSRCSDSSKNPP